jgi:hypothetical protein
MTSKSVRLRKFVPYLFGLSIIAILWVALVEMGILPSPNSTITETQLRIHDLNGHDYEVKYTNSDGLSKDENVSVYASRSKKDGELPFIGWFRKKTLLFEYDPGIANLREPKLGWNFDTV